MLHPAPAFVQVLGKIRSVCVAASNVLLLKFQHEQGVKGGVRSQQAQQPPAGPAPRPYYPPLRAHGLLLKPHSHWHTPSCQSPINC